MILKNNKIIWIYWHNGWENAPLISKLCLQSWINQNPNYLIIPLDNKQLIKFIDLKNFKLQYLEDIDIVSLSDIIRIALLQQYGGVWVDSTVLCLRNIENLLVDYYEYGFFAYDSHAPHVPISSWFLYAEQKSLVVEKWMEGIINYWKNRKIKDQYFWVHILFDYLYKNNKEVAQIWKNMPKKIATEKDLNGPHAFVPYQERLNGSINDYFRNYIDNGYNNNFCLKLSRHWNTSFFLQQSNTTINYIFKKEKLI
jgi:hypothetical protein